VIAIGCDAAHAADIVYADGLDLEKSVVGIGLSCRLCDRAGCRSRAFPPLAHRLVEVNPLIASSATPYQFEPRG
jgi:predicted transcriptional regulator